jgi:predicted nucleic acid-binding protein
MQSLVVDTNILISALISPNKDIRVILRTRGYKFYSCYFLIVEILKHKEKILKLSKIPEADFLLVFHSVLKQLIFINEDIISPENYQKAYSITHEADPKDTAFVALALHVGCPLWTGDKKLTNHLTNTGYSQLVVNTQEIKQRLGLAL